MNETTQWLLEGPSWVEYRTRIDLLEQPEDSPEVVRARQATLEDTQVTALVTELAGWPGNPTTGVSKAIHPLNKFVFLADIGLTTTDPGLQEIINKVLTHRSSEGAFMIGSSGGRDRSWKLCDFPSILYALVKMGMGEDPRVRKAVDYVTGFSFENGWPCVMSRELDWFMKLDPGDDPCPVVNVIALKTLAILPEWRNSQTARDGVGTLLDLWEQRRKRRPNLFGMGKRFSQLKAPFVWYDILHVLEVLTQFPFILGNDRLVEMLDVVGNKADSDLRFTIESAGNGWEEWEFGQGREPSRWLTLLVHRIFKRAGLALESRR
ncbi:hypothetical protein ACFLXY_10280 [Chloroflexota bacterium]